MAYFDRTREPVITDIGPVLDLEDAVGGKVAALASRAYERDYLDTAAALGRYSPAELIAFARRLDPGLDGQDFAEAGQRLDQMPDYAFTSFGLSQQDVARLRERFAAWPREPEAVAADTAEDTSRHLGQARKESADAAIEATAGQTGGRHDVREAEPDEPEIEPLPQRARPAAARWPRPPGGAAPGSQDKRLTLACVTTIHLRRHHRDPERNHRPQPGPIA